MRIVSRLSRDGHIFFQSAEKSICPIFYDFAKTDMSENKIWDKEYATSFYNEVVELRKRGIRYTWVYKNENGISVWKYKKDRELWLALAEMYKNKRYEV